MLQFYNSHEVLDERLFEALRSNLDTAEFARRYIQGRWPDDDCEFDIERALLHGAERAISEASGWHHDTLWVAEWGADAEQFAYDEFMAKIRAARAARTPDDHVEYVDDPELEARMRANYGVE